MKGYEQLTEADARRLGRQQATSAPVTRSKYRAVKTSVDGIVFDSAKEARRYGELKLREKAGEISDLELQPEFHLFVPIYSSCARQQVDAIHTGGVYCIGIYRGDFKYREPHTLPYVVEDVKGFKTPLYRWKKKHVEAQYGIVIRET